MRSDKYDSYSAGAKKALEESINACRDFGQHIICKESSGDKKINPYNLQARLILLPKDLILFHPDLQAVTMPLPTALIPE